MPRRSSSEPLASSLQHWFAKALSPLWSTTDAATNNSLPLSIDAVTGQRLVQFASSGRAAPLLYHCFESGGWPEQISTKARRELERSYFNSAARNLELLEACELVCHQLSDKGIRPIVFKGADLASRLYPNAALRPMNDLDILVDSSEVDSAERVLRSLGYRPWCPEMAPGLNRNARHARLFVAPNGVNVDLHWSLVAAENDDRAPDLAWFHQQSRQRRHWWSFSTTSHLLYLTAHMKLQHQHEEPPLVWLVDLRILANQPGIEPGLLLEQAERVGWSKALAAALTEATERLPGRWPDWVEQTLSKLSSERKLSPTIRVAPGSQKAKEEHALEEMGALGWRGRARLAHALLLPSPGYLRWRYRGWPRWAWPLLYPRRWYQVAAGAVGVCYRRLVSLFTTFGKIREIHTQSKL